MRGAAILSTFVACLLVAPYPALPHDEFLPGQSHQGPAFDRGPRWAAYLMGGTGDVHFPVTSKNPLVQKFIEQGVGQLHGFWYVEAERSFRQAAALDPDCGIAYWGMSVAERGVAARTGGGSSLKRRPNTKPASAIAKRCTSTRSRTRRDIAIASKYPNDLEAKAFEVWRLWHKAEERTARARRNRQAMGLAARYPARQADAPDAPRSDPHHRRHRQIRRRFGLRGQMRRSGSLDRPYVAYADAYLRAFSDIPRQSGSMEASIRTEHARMMHDRVLPGPGTFVRPQ